MTSVYRQIGIGCQNLFRTILRDSFGLSDEDVTWSYEILLPTGRKRLLYLDGRVPLDRIPDKSKRDRFHEWMRESANEVGINPKGIRHPGRNGLRGSARLQEQGLEAPERRISANAATTIYQLGYLP